MFLHGWKTHIHFSDSEAHAHNMKGICPAERNGEMKYIMIDPSHVSKIHNNILKSYNNDECTILLTLPAWQETHWSMWADAFNWDRQNSMQIHRKFTDENLNPSNACKTRNKLAEDLLDSEMHISFILKKVLEQR